MITLTAKANAKLKEFSEAEGIGHCCVRTKVIAGGCSGFTHDFEFDDQIAETDEVIESDGVKIVIDMMSAQYMEGITIDYKEGLLGEGFEFKGGKVSGKCGCGNSYSFETDTVDDKETT